MAQINLKIMHQFAVAEGEAKGRMDALRLAVETVCEVLGVELDEERKDALQRLDVDGLAALLGQLRTERQWPHED